MLTPRHRRSEALRKASASYALEGAAAEPTVFGGNFLRAVSAAEDLTLTLYSDPARTTAQVILDENFLRPFSRTGLHSSEPSALLRLELYRQHPGASSDVTLCRVLTPCCGVRSMGRYLDRDDDGGEAWVEVPFCPLCERKLAEAYRVQVWASREECLTELIPTIWSDGGVLELAMREEQVRLLLEEVLRGTILA